MVIAAHLKVSLFHPKMKLNNYCFFFFPLSKCSKFTYLIKNVFPPFAAMIGQVYFEMKIMLVDGNLINAQWP